MSKKAYTVNPDLVEKTEDITLEEGHYVTVAGKGGVDKVKVKAKKSDIEVVETKPPEVAINPIDLEFDEWGDHDYADLDEESTNPIALGVTFLQKLVTKSVQKLQKLTRGNLFTIIFLALYFAYFIAAMIHEFGDEGSIRLLVCTVIGVMIFISSYCVQAGTWLYVKVVGEEGMDPNASRWFRLTLRWILYLAMVGVIVWSIVDNADDSDSLRGIPGFFAFLVLCLFCSTNPKKINWHTIFWGVGIQFLFGICTLKFKFGQDAVEYVQEMLDEFFDNAKGASTLLFGPETHQHQLLFESLPIVFMTSAFIGLLYYVGAMQFLIKVIGAFMSFIMDTQPVESLAVAAGIFLDGTSAVVSLSPLLPSQSRSQMFMILTSCFASLGGAYLAILSQFGLPLTTVLPAMLISAPATFAVCKLMYPESRPANSKLNSLATLPKDRHGTDPFDAFRAGSMVALPIIGSIIAVGFSYVSAIAWMNHTLEWFGERVGKNGFTLEYLLSYMFYPVALAMGIKPNECRVVGKILGIRLLSTNFIAFLNMLPLIGNRYVYEAYMESTNFTGPIEKDGDDMFLVYFNRTLPGGIISERSQVITTFSLCGFSSFLTMAFTIAAFHTFVPDRIPWLSKISVPALLAGNIANCMTACVASLFY